MTILVCVGFREVCPRRTRLQFFRERAQRVGNQVAGHDGILFPGRNAQVFLSAVQRRSEDAQRRPLRSQLGSALFPHSRITMTT